ncbi:glucose-6-phosphate dehydrogenase assembly protein OpcA [Actinoalloteichus hymeniacidonis]|uniref:Glucose-6-phosphate dehydrogenase assembly protein OpcA n=1 Tax=Actinoalloteichus hymeniacidonis TaxID=340345 RepID=A0AAC9MYD7_9PSEU|nr:glucose-6-phosphate dehydrogenase assembly protein OpcA [Actinoalloteichus hymeniacidonis]AOS63150.1 glucose-6-phosphate dehydrogenase assembly protein OpcA [Actinoalloteichus hymeniacidonis]MBB5908813.1 glucose-6-phosphate dehydrogenase assembly protein OpcA [Actinoalloteichus hymeniacidonis]
MIIDLPSTTTSKVNKKLVELRESGGAVALGRVLTLAIITDDGTQAEEAIAAANEASREHPCRVVLIAKGARRAAARLDAQIRVGGDAGASEVIMLRLYGPLADEGASCLVPLLLPDAPVVAWWPYETPKVPADDPIGRLAHRRITDAKSERNPVKALEHRAAVYADGDTDLAWTRLTSWRALLATALDLPPHEKVESATVTGRADSPSTTLLAAWLATALQVPVQRVRSEDGQGIVSVVLERPSGKITLDRPDGQVATLTQPGQPDRRVTLHRRSVRDCLIEELRRLDPDEIYSMTLKALPKVERRGSGTSAGRSTVKRSTRSSAKSSVASVAGKTTKTTKPSAATGAKASARAVAKSAGIARGGRRTAEPKPSRRSSAASARARGKAVENGEDAGEQS